MNKYIFEDYSKKYKREIDLWYNDKEIKKFLYLLTKSMAFLYNFGMLPNRLTFL